MQKYFPALITLIFLAFQCVAQSPGDYRTATSSVTWSNASDWQIRGSTQWSIATTAPGATDHIFIQTGHTVTLTANAACNNLNIENSSASHLSLGVYTLNVNGILRAFTQTSPSATGTTDGTLYGGSSASPPSGTSWISSTTGKISITGGSRTLTGASQWGATNAGVANPNGFDLEINLNTGATVICNTALKARTVSINSGTLDMQSNRLSADQGTVSGSNITIQSGATLISAQTGTGSQVAARTASSRLDAFTLASGATLMLSGTSPTVDANTVALNGTVVYNRTGSQTLLQKGSDAASVQPTIYANLTIDGTGTKTAPVATTVNGALLRQGSGSFNASSSISYGASATLEYAGSALQTTGVEFPAVNPPLWVKINNASNVALSGTHTITGNLDLTLGALIVSGSSALIIADNATVSHASSLSFVAGPVTKIGDDAFTFPVGGSSKYRPVTISAPANTTDAFTVQYFSGAYSVLTVGASSGLNHISYKEYWDVARTAGTSTIDLTLNWGSGSGVDGSLLGALRLAHFNGTDWDNLGVGTVTSGNIQLTGVSSFSPFTIASTSPSQPLKFQLLTFSRKGGDMPIALQWTSSCESGLKSFHVQRDTGGGFEDLASLPAQNIGRDQVSSYEWTEPAACGRQALYRLILTDLDGNTTSSEILRIAEGSDNQVSLSPNPAERYLHLTGLRAGQQLVLTDASGRVMMCRKALAEVENLNLESFAAGLYFLFAEGQAPEHFLKE